MSKPFLIAIAGPSGSGKTAVSRGVAEALEASIVSLDSYYRDLAHLPEAEKAQTNFDDPASLDEALLLDQARALARGETVDVPVYDFAHHAQSGLVQRVEPSAFVIIEGLFTLYWESLRALCGVKVFVDASHEVCFDRRLRRDMAERGRSAESVHRQYEDTVRPMCDRYILPTREFADLVVDGEESLDLSVAQVVAHARRESLKPPSAQSS